MTDTSYAFTDPRAQTQWAADTFDDALELMRMTPLMGQDAWSIIRVNSDLKAKAGGTVVFDCDDELTGAGVGDDGDTTNQAQQLTTKNQSVTVHTRATRTQLAGMQSAQLTRTKGVQAFRQKSKEKLANWQARVMERDLLGSLTGECNENYSAAAIQTINEVYPTSTRILYLGQTVTATPALGNSGTAFATDALLSADTNTNELFGTLVLQRARRMAVTASPRMRPGRFRQIPASQEHSIFFPPQGGKQGKVIGDFFVVFASPYQIESMRSEVGATGFNSMIQAAAERGNDNPIFTGAAIPFLGMLVCEWELIPYRTGAGGTTLAEGFLLNGARNATTDPVGNGKSVARALLLGANAGIWSWAMPFGWWEDVYDANKPIVKTEGIYGCKVNQWSSHGTSTPVAEVSRLCIDTQIVL
ncbi:MAG: DUF4043 family protein [Planctomycetaceae bacterium]|nr:DUF4043 family protein [Planctomycetaceae bacterium]